MCLRAKSSSTQADSVMPYRAHMKSSVDEAIFNRDLDFSQEQESAAVLSSNARVHQKTIPWVTSHGVYYLPAGETRRSYLGHATTPAPIYGARSSRPAPRPLPLHMRETQFACEQLIVYVVHCIMNSV